MRMPIKLNRSYWAQFITRALPSAEDPRVLLDAGVDQGVFTRAISTFKFKTTQKTTQKDRFPLTIEALKGLSFTDSNIVLDVGASDGITSLDVMDALSPKKYFVTDLNIYVYYIVSDGLTYFYDESKTCILIVTDRFIIYSDSRDAIFPAGYIANLIFRTEPRSGEINSRIELINPALRRRSNKIVVEKYDIFTPWANETVGLVIAGNILNKVYFTTDQILRALRNLVQALDDTGRLAVIDNRQVESSTIFQLKANKLVVERQINGGAEIEDIVLENRTYLTAMV